MFSIRQAAVATVTTAMIAGPLAAAPAQAAVGTAPLPNHPQFNGRVIATAVKGSTVYVGGSFTRITSVNGTRARRGAAAYNVRTGEILRWNPRTDGTVNALAVGKEGVYIGGAFDRVRGVDRSNLALVSRGNGGVKKKFRHNVNRTVRAIALDKQRIYVGGAFKRVDGKRRTGLASFSRKAPYRLQAWAPRAARGPVNVIETHKKDLFVGGRFWRMNGVLRYGRLARITKSRGNIVRSFNPRVRFQVFDVEVTRNRVYAGVGGANGGYAAAYRMRNGRMQWNRVYDGDVQALALLDGLLYTGGHFANACATDRTEGNGTCVNRAIPRERLAALNKRGNVTSWDPGANSPYGVGMLNALKGRWLQVGGDFTRTGGADRARYAVYR